MDLIEVRVTLIGDGAQEGLLAYCTLAFDRVFVVHDVKLIRLEDRYLVSMPSRKLTGHCVRCRETNHVRASFCNKCGSRFEQPLIPKIDPNLEPRLERSKARDSYHIDVAHPVNRGTRTRIEELVLEEYRRERARIVTTHDIPAAVGA